ncbi:hypothetical protein SCYZ1_8 [Pseudomonas phage SCYZ1]|nr:hypothetical protein SCYZ1_8 [Pseudomonas phage SCYZ1]
MGKSKVFYEKLDKAGDLTLSGGLKAAKVQRAKSRKHALNKHVGFGDS